MKKIAFYFVLLTIMLSLASCGFENDAKKHMKKTMSELAKDPKSFKIKDVDVVYSTDSLVILQFEGEGKNSFGANVHNKYEYIYLRYHDGTLLYSVKNLSDEPSVLQMAKYEWDEQQELLEIGISSKFMKEKDELIYDFSFDDCIKHEGLVIDGSVQDRFNDVENW